MTVNAKTRPDMSVEFLSWINAELRERVQKPAARDFEEVKNAGLVKRLKAYIVERLSDED